ncbi:hypothetical protein B0T21DRAFT_396029 [Apiosordaria backusii]|uniref:Uncharacterized protein n=1 Tax=Apiosordaria backusii TaxID=314023 RepID=A0AA40DYN7_9PEZI|nr:hypothetical protein B0T21DRAFT_396029 [Apiosordaria backusii]
METIHETNSGPRTPAMAGLAAEAMMFTVKPNRKTQTMHATAMNQTGRSASMKAPIARKTSLRIRNWVNRSKSSGAITSRSADTAPSVNPRPRITHLGGGRIEEEEGIERHATPSAPLTGARMTPQGRATSADSRRTQWLDFYSEDLPTKPPSGNPSSARLRPPKTPDLRPLPLRVPSLERKCEAHSLPEAGPKIVLTRKSSKWKALPGLPIQSQSACASTESADVEKLMGKIMLDTPPLAGSGREPDQKEPDTGSTLPNTVYTAQPVTGLGTPPPTPDSASGSKATAVSGSKAHVLTPASSWKTSSSTAAGRYTRQERMWLHHNYRGEAPFLAAWGLDITSQQDREEGVSIVKELMMEQMKK